MYPVRETLAKTDEQAIQNMEASPSYQFRKRYWAPDPVTQRSYFGRGFVQLTFADHYQWADQRLGRDADAGFYANPDLALDLDGATDITFDGMIYGWFTPGNCLLRYFAPNKRPQWMGARKIINGNDRWREVGTHAHTFWTILSHLK
jgi:hypothetical protein